ncbi:MAG: AAA family ATPase [Roseburia sp.]|nr:AAA family ATPase [Roseburia sp.]
MSRIIAIANQKGGVGKTTTTINLGVGLSKTGKKVCLIDLDPQGNTTQGLGYNPDDIEVTISTIFDRVISRDYIFGSDYGVLHHKEGIDVVPSNIELSAMEMKLISIYIGREKILSTYLEMIKQQYDYILIDCKPSLDIITLNALTAADSVLIPVQAQYYSAKGLEQLLSTINQVVTGGINTRLKVDGILFTLANDRTCNFKQVSEIIRNAYGQNIYIYTNYIPRSVKAEEAPTAGVSIYEYDGGGAVAEAYGRFTDEFLQEEKGYER